MDQVKEGSVAVSISVIGAWAAKYFGDVDVPVEVIAASAVVLTGVGRLIGKVVDRFS